MLAVTGSKPDAHVRLFFLAFGALGSESQRAQKGGFCAAALEGVASLGVCRGSLNSHFCRCVYCNFGLIYTPVGGHGFEIRGARAIFFPWLLVLWGASHSAGKKASCARPHWRKLRVWGLAAGRLFPPRFNSMRGLRFIKRRSRVLRRRTRQAALDKPRVHEGQWGFSLLSSKVNNG